MKIKIKWLYDSHSCEDCGYSDAEGALITFENGQQLHLKPVAHCYEGQSWEPEEVYTAILKELGYELEYEHGAV